MAGLRGGQWLGGCGAGRVWGREGMGLGGCGAAGVCGAGVGWSCWGVWGWVGVGLLGGGEGEVGVECLCVGC